MKELEKIVFSIPDIKFTSYEEYKKQATILAEYIDGIELTEENVKMAKQTLADARKVIKKLDDSRKEVKNRILDPYERFKEKCDEIIAIVDSADKRLRDEVRVMEEQEREVRKIQLHEIWDKRINMYSFTQYIPDAFDKWLEPCYLNKTTTLKRAEQEMTAWMEDREADIEMISRFNDNEIFVEYAGCLDAGKAISIVHDRHEKLNELQDDVTATFIVEGKANIKLVEMLLNENEIKFKRR